MTPSRASKNRHSSRACLGQPINLHSPYPASYHGQSQHMLRVILFLYLEGERAGVAWELTAWKRLTVWMCFSARRAFHQIPFTCSHGLTGHSHGHVSGTAGALGPGPPRTTRAGAWLSPPVPAAAGGPLRPHPRRAHVCIPVPQPCF